MKKFACIAAILLAMVSFADAATIVLKDGRFVTGEIVRETNKRIQVDIGFGIYWYDRKDIEEILETATTDADAVNKFNELSEPMRAVLNAEADYRLGNYESAKARLEPHLEYDEQPGLRKRIDWLWIELLERDAQWEEVTKLLKKKKKKGDPREKERATAHLDILEANSGEGVDAEYSLQWVVKGGRHAREFLSKDELKLRAREPNALADVELMNAALEQYCNRFLIYSSDGIRKFEFKLKVPETIRAVKEASGRDIVTALPYYDDMAKAEQAVYRAESILGEEYASGYEKDIVLIEAEHLFFVLHNLLIELINRSPEFMIPAIDPRTNRLTPPGRAQWRRQCDAFLDAAKPVGRLSRYMQDRAERYPRHMYWMRTVFGTHMERFDQMVKAVKRAKSITRF